jgi:hypothetical protein
MLKNIRLSSLKFSLASRTNNLANCGDAIVRGKETGVDTIFDTHQEYSRLLAGAHRRRVTPLGAPALVRHVAFWNPAGWVPAQTDAEPAGSPPGAAAPVLAEPVSIVERAKAADKAIAAIYRRLLDRQASRARWHPIEKVETNSLIAVDAGELVVLFSGAMDAATGDPVDCPHSIRLDSYRAIKIAFLWHGVRATLSFELHTEFLALTMTVDASRKRSSASLKRDRARYGPKFEDHYTKLLAFTHLDGTPKRKLRALHTYVYDTFWNRFSADILAPLKGHKDAIGEKFVDFRGLVLGTVCDDGKVSVASPFTRDSWERGTGKERDPQCDIIDFDGLWTFATCAHSEGTEVTLSRFLDDRAFYATSLGSHAELLSGGGEKPLHYLLYEDTINAWQLGRLVYRIHRAGTSRLAAIIHFEQLRQANQILTEVEAALEDAIAALADADDDTFRGQARRLYKEVEEKLAKIAPLDLDGTLDSRIDRSRYYVNQFSATVGALRIRRVKGFQQYDEFVIQRLGPVFDYIDSLGRKYARVQKDRSLLLTRIQTLDSQHNENQISELQRLADIALSCILAPYYIGSVWAHAVEGILDPQYVWLAAFWFGPIMYILLLIRKRIWNSIRKRWSLFLMAVSLSVVATALSAGPFRALIAFANQPASRADHSTGRQGEGAPAAGQPPARGDGH